MDDMSLVYNTNLCRICQIPDNLDLVNTSTVTDIGVNYLDLLKYIFQDITWIEDTLLSLACHSCIKKIKDTADFKSICFESNNRRGRVNVTQFKIDNETKVFTDTMDAEPDVMDADLIDSTVICRRPVRAKRCLLKNIESPSKCKRINNAISRKTSRRLVEESTNALEQINVKLPKKGRGKAKTPKIHHCDFCHLEFKNLEDFDRHIYKHNGTRNYICTVCGRTYITRDDLKQHSYRHNTEAKYSCPECPSKKYKTAKDLRTHKKIVHTNKEDFKYLCTECGVKFPQLCGLKTHIIRRHSKIRQYKCDMCDKSFAEKRDLQHHYVTHSNVRAFKCDLCDSEYKRKDVLLNHKTKRHGIGNYKFHVNKKCECSFCGKKITKDKLKRHVRTHTGVKPYTCRLCNMKFICNSYIKGHLKVKHDFDTDGFDFDVKMYYDVCHEESIIENRRSGPVNVSEETAVLVKDEPK